MRRLYPGDDMFYGIGAALACAVLFYAWPAAAKLAVTDVKIGEAVPRYEIDLTYPKTGHEAIDAEIGAFVEETLKDFRDAAQEASAEMPYSLSGTYMVAGNTDLVFSVTIDIGEYTGGAHPNSATTSFTFLMPDGWLVYLPEIAGTKGLKRISEIAIAELKAKFAADGMAPDNEWIERGAGPFAENYTAFGLSDDTLSVYFDSYQVASYADGPQEVSIPLAKLSGTLRSDWRSPLASFDCAKAGTGIEKAICADAKLARLDRRVSETYFARLRMMDDDGKEQALKASQRAWLAERDKNCVGQSGDALTACLSAAYEARGRALPNDAY